MRRARGRGGGQRQGAEEERRTHRMKGVSDGSDACFGLPIVMSRAKEVL